MSQTPITLRQPRDPRTDVWAAEALPVLVAIPVVDAIAVDEPVVRHGILRRVWNFLTSMAEWVFGAAALILGLSVLAAIPVLQFLSLGYLLESGGRVARSGRLRDAFIGVRQSARLGSIAIGCALVWLPLYLASSLAASAQVIDPDGVIARRWEVGMAVLTGLGAFHVMAACARGGRLRYFFWPFNFVWLARRLWRGGYYGAARDAVWDFVTALRLPYYFWLGVRGFVGASLWLAIPVTLLGLGHKHPLAGILGACALMLVLQYVPFVQMRFARENRFRAFFEVRAIRAEFKRAPVAFFLALFFTLALALPLYLMKIEMIPREMVFLESLVFLALIFPARVITGWASGRALRRAAPRHWTIRYASWLLMVPTIAFYVLILFFTQHLAWGGVSSLYEQHAFLLPVPFSKMP